VYLRIWELPCNVTRASIDNRSNLHEDVVDVTGRVVFGKIWGESNGLKSMHFAQLDAYKN